MSLTGYTVFFGGSFDPPHLGHQLSCLYLLEGLDAADVWLVPSWSHPFGKPLTDFAARFAMCERMATPFGSRVKVSDVEQRLGIGRTFDVLSQLQRDEPGRRFALAIGADILAETARWHRWADLAAMVRIVVIGRAGFPAAGTLEMPAVASRVLRERLAVGASVEGLVPCRVAEYIAAHNLYRAAP